MKQFLKNRLLAFKPAFSGLYHGLKKEAAIKVHVTACAIIVLVILVGNFSMLKNLLMLIACAVVLATELLNTAIEKLCDLYSTSFHPSIKVIKDLSAAAVLVTVILALLVASYVVLY